MRGCTPVLQYGGLAVWSPLRWHEPMASAIAIIPRQTRAPEGASITLPRFRKRLTGRVCAEKRVLFQPRQPHKLLNRCFILSHPLDLLNLVCYKHSSEGCDG